MSNTRIETTVDTAIAAQQACEKITDMLTESSMLLDEIARLMEQIERGPNSTAAEHRAAIKVCDQIAEIAEMRPETVHLQYALQELRCATEQRR